MVAADRGRRRGRRCSRGSPPAASSPTLVAGDLGTGRSPEGRVPVHRPGLAVRRAWVAGCTTRSRRSAPPSTSATAILDDHLDRPLLSVLFPEPGTDSPIDDTTYTQPALFAVEYALATMWARVGRAART